MSSEENISWDLLRNVADALDSYRVRALIDSKKDILEAGVYDEEQYENILLAMIDNEKLKYSLNNMLKRNSQKNFDAILQFSNENSIDLFKSLSLLELLKNEGLLIVEEVYDIIKGDENSPDKQIFKDLTIEIRDNPSNHLRTIYEPVSIIFDTKNCSGCGLCAGICPVNCLQIYNGFGKIEDTKCIRCGLCYYVCPRTYLPVKVLNMVQEKTSEIIEYPKVGYYLEAYSAKTKIPEISETCQDGGITSTCLYHLFDMNKIDYAIGAKMSTTLWRPEPLLLEKKEDILLTTGTKYVNNPNLQLLNQKRINSKRIAVVGVPCQMQALLKSDIYNIGFPSLNNIEYKIGIFCMESFSYQALLEICKKLNVDIKDAKKMDINKGKFFVFTQNGEEHTIPIKEIGNLAREDCEMCFDLTSESADISIGSIGSPSGWNTVLIRTKKGKYLFDELVNNNLIDVKPIEEVKPGMPLLQRIAGSKKNKSKKHIDTRIEKKERVPNY